MLYGNKKVIEQYSEVDPDNADYRILFLFFQIRNQFCLLLGREKIERSEEQEEGAGSDEEDEDTEKISESSS